MWLEKVRHLPAGSIAWYPSTDKLQGTDTFGDPTNDLLPWGIQFDNNAYNQILFTTNDSLNWVILDK